MIEKKIEKWQYYSGIGVIFIGIIHILAVFFVFNSGFESLSKDNFISTVYMFLATGVAVIFTGILVVYNSNGVRHLENRAWYTLLFCNGFLMLIGLGSVVIMPANLFTWIMLIAAFIQLYPLVRFDKYFQKNCRDMLFVHQTGIVKEYLKDADHIDVKYYDADLDLKDFIAAFMSYHPWWISLLYKIRKVFVKFLGMSQEDMPDYSGLKPEDISMKPGDMVTFFKVEKALENEYWIAGGSDKHLEAQVGILIEKKENGINRFHIITIVHHRDWSGPFFFNVFRPFHHIVLHAMAKRAIISS